MTSSISALCFSSRLIGSGELWGWLQNIVGVSTQVGHISVRCGQDTENFPQIAWLSIGLSSWRFRKAWIQQGRSLEELKFRASWTWPWGPPFVVRKLYRYCVQILSVNQVITVTLLIMSKSPFVLVHIALYLYPCIQFKDGHLLSPNSLCSILYHFTSKSP